MSKYPAQIDNSITLPAAVDNSTPVNANIFNNVRSAVLQIEAELGVNPSGISSTVRGRLDTIDTTLLGAVKLSNDLGNTADHPYVIGIQGRPVSSQDPIVGDILGWNGIVWMPLAPAPGITTVFSGDLTGLYPTPTVVRIQGNPIESGTLGSIQDGYTLTWVNAFNQWQAKPAAIGFSAGGDLTGTNVNQIVIGIQGNPINNTLLGATQDGYILTWVNGSTEWQAKIAPVGFSAGGDLTGTATNQKVISLTGVAGTLPVVSTAANIQWTADTTGLQLSQLGATTDITPSDFTIIPQAPFAGATTAAHKTPGRVVIKFPLLVAGGSDPSFVLNYNSTDYYTINPHPAAPGTSIGTPSGYLMQMSSGPHGSIILAPGYTLIQAAFGGYLTFQWNTSVNFGYVDATSWRISDTTANTTAGALYQFDFSTTSKIHFGVRATSATIIGDTQATTASPMTIQAANVTTGTGSDLILTSGTGSVANGSVIFKSGTTTVATASSAKLISNIGRRVITTNTTTNINVTDADEIIVVGVLGAGITVTLPATPAAGDIYTIKDQAGGAAIHNIIIDGNGHNIDGVATYTMSVNFQSVDVVFANSTWCII